MTLPEFARVVAEMRRPKVSVAVEVENEARQLLPYRRVKAGTFPGP